MSSRADDDGEGEQILELTIEEASIVRGALNVVCELLRQPAIEVPPGLPISRDRLELFNRLNRRVEHRVEQAAAIDVGRIGEVLGEPEAQAIRDAAGAIEDLLADPGGREVLAAVGFIVDPDDPGQEREVEILMSVRERIEPTRVREDEEAVEVPGLAPEAEPEPDADIVFEPTTGPQFSHEDVLGVIDETREALGNTFLAPDDSLEQLFFRAQNAEEAAAERRLSCNAWFVNLADLVEIVVAAAGNVAASSRPPREIETDLAEVLDAADDAQGAITDRMVGQGCLDGLTAADLDSEFEVDVGEPAFRVLTDEDAPEELRDEAFQYLTNLRIVFRDQEQDQDQDTRDGGEPDQDVDTELLDTALRGIQRGIDTLDDREANPRGPEQIIEIARRRLEALREGEIRGGCAPLFILINEAALLDLEVTAGTTPTDQAALRAVNDVRRAAMSVLDEECGLDDETIRSLRNSFIEIHNPSEPARAPPAIDRAEAFLLELRQVARQLGGGTGRTTSGP